MTKFAELIAATVARLQALGVPACDATSPRLQHDARLVEFAAAGNYRLLRIAGPAYVAYASRVAHDTVAADQRAEAFRIINTLKRAVDALDAREAEIRETYLANLGL